jgi:acyl carrier protein
MSNEVPVFEAVKALVVKTIGIEDRADRLTAETALLDSIPEFDSMAVLQVVLAIEEHFGVTIDTEDVTGEVFETLGTLAGFVAGKLK